ncbi:MAG TPA: hypothetical protein VLD61_02000 [Methylomirabilota bacterium]|nr:hypothetical protein [Methylomirabilota bacterium]
MAKLALLVSLIALGVAILAYREVGGTKDLPKKIETLRQETADALSRMEKALRGVEGEKKP